MKDRQEPRRRCYYCLVGDHFNRHSVSLSSHWDEVWSAVFAFILVLFLTLVALQISSIVVCVLWSCRDGKGS